MFASAYRAGTVPSFPDSQCDTRHDIKTEDSYSESSFLKGMFPKGMLAAANELCRGAGELEFEEEAREILHQQSATTTILFSP